jgi:mannose-6-phosphate isomerase-like protein (cupin superfamily)
MRGVWFLLACLVAIVSADGHAQRRGSTRGGGSVTLAIFVTDPDGKPVPDVMVTLEGPAQRSARTEGGRIALENLPPGNYRLRFERAGFISLERELTARAGAPIDVKVTLNRAPEQPPPPAPRPAEPEKSSVNTNAKLAVFDVPAVFEREYGGKGSEKMTPLACGSEGTATLIQVRESVAQHAHEDADEFLYVIGGEGSAQVAGRSERLKAGVLVFVPRGVVHTLTATGRKPLVLVSTRAGEGCADGR